MRTFFLFILIFAFSGNNYSQTTLGIKAGLNLSKAVYLNDHNEELIKPIRQLKPGFVSGLFVRQTLNKVLGVQAEVLYSQKGLKTTQLPYNTTVNTMNYVEVPLLGQYTVSSNKHSSLDLYIGGYAAYWTDGKYKITDLISGETLINKVDFHNSEYTFSRIDAGVLGGVMYKAEKMELDFRYSHSMTGSSELNADALTNRVLSFGINFIFTK